MGNNFAYPGLKLLATSTTESPPKSSSTSPFRLIPKHRWIETDTPANTPVDHVCIARATA